VIHQDKSQRKSDTLGASSIGLGNHFGGKGVRFNNYSSIFRFYLYIIMEGGVKETLEQKAWREHLLGQFNKMMETMME